MTGYEWLFFGINQFLWGFLFIGRWDKVEPFERPLLYSSNTVMSIANLGFWAWFFLTVGMFIHHWFYGLGSFVIGAVVGGRIFEYFISFVLGHILSSNGRD